VQIVDIYDSKLTIILHLLIRTTEGVDTH